MDRRQFLKAVAAIPVVSAGASKDLLAAGQPVSRVRPGDPGWPPRASWEKLKQAVGGWLIELKSPLAASRTAPESAASTRLFKELKNPYYIGDQPALTQTCGYLDAWTSTPSVYAVAAATECFRMLAKAIAANDASLYRPTEPANTHWSNWPFAGSI